jgi:Uri superfamily endonuclease
MSAGTYMIVLEIKRSYAIKIGALGTFRFAPGFYLYVGRHSTMLWKRVQRHLAGGGAKRWHVDYLRSACRPVEAWIIENSLDECGVADRLVRCGGTRSVTGFGASDCRCPGHLVYFEGRPKARLLEQDF